MSCPSVAGHGAGTRMTCDGKADSIGRGDTPYSSAKVSTLSPLGRSATNLLYSSLQEFFNGFKRPDELICLGANLGLCRRVLVTAATPRNVAPCANSHTHLISRTMECVELPSSTIHFKRDLSQGNSYLSVQVSEFLHSFVILPKSQNLPKILWLKIMRPDHPSVV